MYTRIFIDLMVETPYGTDNIHTIEIEEVYDPDTDERVTSGIVDIYKRMSAVNFNRKPFSCIKVSGFYEDASDDDDYEESDEEELFCVYKEDLVSKYGVKIIEYNSVWTGEKTCM